MKPIEEGCRAVIVKSRAGNEGTVVTVLRYIGKIDGWGGDDRWEIDTPLKNTLGAQPECHVRECCLKRIDDEETTTWEHVAKTCHFIPGRETA